MKLELTHTSSPPLQPFSVENLPDFVLLTGENASGKTLLLRALSNGHAKAYDTQGNELAARYYDSQSFSNREHHQRNDPNAHDLAVRRTEAAYFIEKVTRATREKAEAFFKENQLTSNEIEALVTYFVPGRSHPMGQDDPLFNLVTRFRPLLQDHLDFGEYNDIAGLSAIKALKPVHLLSLTDVERSHIEPAPMVSMSFIKAFDEYRDSKLSNRHIKLANEDGDMRVAALSDAEFEEKYGVPPWEIVDKALAILGLDLTAERPVSSMFTGYRPQLIARDGRRLPLDSLSSGQQVMLSLALILSNSEFRRPMLKPNLYLLDEIDSPLHPRMAMMFLQVINDIIVQKLGCKVIVVTHSPSTVALFPGDTVYVMTSHGPVARSKAEALDALTVGVPTLSLDFSGIRQVFCEDDSDAEALTHLYRRLKPSVSSERSLTFISSGLRKSGTGTVGGGCQMVEKVVSQLRENGNKTVFGIVDGDGSSRDLPSHIHKIGRGERNGLENYLFDPLLLASLLVKSHPAERATLDLPSGVIDFLGSDDELLQTIIGRIENRLFPTPNVRKAEVQYQGRRHRFHIDSRFLTTDDHDLGELVMGAFDFKPVLKTGTPSTAALIRHICIEVVPDFTDFLPTDISQTFRDLTD